MDHRLPFRRSPEGFFIPPIAILKKAIYLCTMSNAKMLSHSALWQEAFGVSPSPVRPFVFYAGTRVDADKQPIYDQCVIGYGETEQQARTNAEAILYGKVGHNGYHIGEKIPVI